MNSHSLQSVIVDLVNTNQRELAYQVLDHMYRRSTSIADFDILGDLALRAEHRQLYFQCAHRGYALALNTSQRYAARLNLIKALSAANEPEQALRLIAQQLIIDPNNFEMLCQQAACLILQGDRAQAEQLLDQLLEDFPDQRPHIEALLSHRYLREGNLSQGISVFVDTYKEPSVLFEQQLKMKKWDGIARPGRTVYVNGEGGIGDEFINIRFFDHIRRMGMKPVLYSHDNQFYHHKNQLFQRHGHDVLTDAHAIDSRHSWIPMMSLPVTLGLDESQLWSGPYLRAQRQHKNQIHSDQFKIGVKCSGNPYFAQDEYRKIPLEQMLSCLPANADIYYIDTESGHPGTTDLAPHIESWEDTLDFIDQMDCIVSSCTSLAHAAGAMGKTTMVAVPIQEYYVWTSSRTDNSTPWYADNLSVFRQVKPRDWQQPLKQISQRLHSLMAGEHT